MGRKEKCGVRKEEVGGKEMDAGGRERKQKRDRTEKVRKKGAMREELNKR